MVLLWSCFCSEFFGAEDVARKWHSPRRAEVTIAACSGGQAGERRRSTQGRAARGGGAAPWRCCGSRQQGQLFCGVHNQQPAAAAAAGGTRPKAAPGRPAAHRCSSPSAANQGQ